MTKQEIERLIESFQQINYFYEKEGRVPVANIENGVCIEYMLSARLRRLREQPDKIEILMVHDIHNLL